MLCCSNIAGAVTSGFGHGVGFAAASRAVDAVIGPRKMDVVHSNEDSGAAAAAPMNPPRSCQLYVDDLNQVRNRHIIYYILKSHCYIVSPRQISFM